MSKDNESLDSLKRYRDAGSKREMDILYRAKRCWDGLYSMRANRERLMRFTYGSQFIDRVEVGGEVMSESRYWASQGVTVKKNNLIRKMVRSVLGIYKSQDVDFTAIAKDREEQSVAEMMTVTLQSNRDTNRMDEIQRSLVEEFLISGTAFIRESWGWRRGKKDTWSDIVNPNYIFFDGVMQDVRHWDCDIIGQIHDIHFTDILSKFATSKGDYEKLQAIYASSRNDSFMDSYYQQIYSYGRERGDFFTPLDPNICRVIEVWSKEQKPRYRCHDYLNGEFYVIEEEEINIVGNENAKRLQQAQAGGIHQEEVKFIETEWFIDSYWYYRFLSPLGDVLQEGETPFRHHEHPYTIKIYPFVDGKPHSLVEDSIDQQKFVNELITLYVLMAKHSAKGLLMFPEDSMPKGMSIEDIAEQYARVNGMIVYQPKPGVPLPQQLSTNVNNFNISDLLKIQMGMFEEVSGVTGAVQGKAPASGTAATLYSQQADNAINTLVDVLSSFNSFLKEAMSKKLSNIIQYYTDERIVTVAGSQYGKIRKWIPTLAQDVIEDVIISDGTNNPKYREVMNNFLIELYKTGGIAIDQVLKFGDFPKGDALLQDIIQRQEQARPMEN
jgi:hypothetical protein